MNVFFDERQLAHAPSRELHNGDWTDHAEVPDRARDVAALFACEAARDFGRAPLAAVHDGSYLAFLESAFDRWRAADRTGDAIPYTFPVVGRRPLSLERIDALLGQYSFDAATPIGGGTWEGAYWSAQTALSALDAIQTNGLQFAFALCRPPGHHAGRDYMGGYCYLNNAAIAARNAAGRGLGPVAILDLDYHHGNGTQDIFLTDETVFFASIHADPKTDYPFYWGHAEERGERDAIGATLNLPLPRGTSWPAYREALDTALEGIAQWGARMLIVSFGADTFESDPISSFKLTTDDFGRMGTVVASLGLPTLVVLEGGYAVTDLGRNVAAFLAGCES